jgi:pimeloyl-ACP methyl ester carboxylesterase
VTFSDVFCARTHFVTTTDGVTIGGGVHGEGPPLVFVHGMMADGDLDWRALLRHLTGRFTCYLPSCRGPGLSGDHPDLSPGRMVDDILAYVDSIGEPTALVGWSSGAYLAVTVAAAQPEAVNAVAPFEPWGAEPDGRAGASGSRVRTAPVGARPAPAHFARVRVVAVQD